jgi:hypothetical protein
MKLIRPILSTHRLRRLALWTLTVLHWIAANLIHQRAITPRHRTQRGDISLQWLARLVANLIAIRALHILGAQRKASYWRHGRDLRRRHYRRSLLGSKLRRALKHRDLATHIAQLITLLRNLDKEGARLAFRIRHRLRRLWRIMPAIAPAEAPYGAPASSPALSDSS